ncbi:DUF6894 family protein [Belnapia rosea]|uniref:DUF6894 domain-containing protein n=1 Tax=Belnapia rosea TaxID=938405 RepID=A0A1G6R091_9PROT|nr:hypothetical protein [Belnapia rosea]SDC97475.1 hypothetical protein SAMN04487779_1003240 [Belnapia rosea]
MPRFFLHVRTDEDLISDPEGSELPDLISAQNEALVGLRQLVADSIRGSRIPVVQQIEIADEVGQILATVRFQDALQSLEADYRR